MNTSAKPRFYAHSFYVGIRKPRVAYFVMDRETGRPFELVETMRKAENRAGKLNDTEQAALRFYRS